MPAPGHAMHGRGLQLPASQREQPAHGICQHCHCRDPACSSQAGSCTGKGRLTVLVSPGWLCLETLFFENLAALPQGPSLGHS